MVALSLLLNYKAVMDIFGDGAELVAVLFIALAYVIGYLSGVFDKSERVVPGFAASQRNFAAAIVVATQAFGDEPRVLVMAVVISIVAMLPYHLRL